MKNILSREELIALFASDYGYGPEVTETFATEILQKAYESGTPHNYLNALISIENDKKKRH